MAEPFQWCFAWYPPDPIVREGKARAAMRRDAMWQSGETIRIYFLDGETRLKKKVLDFASLWTGGLLANLELVDTRSKKNADVRVSFLRVGSWSAIGNACRRMKDDLETPTLNLGGITLQAPEQTIRRAVLHEFGHVLGLVHEHQSPAGGIRWNRQRVLQDLTSAERRWTPEQVQQNMFDPLDRTETNFTAFDPASIMLYPIPPEWTEDGFTSVLNTNLSQLDRMFIREQYH